MNSNAQFRTIAELDLEPIKLKLMHKESGEGWSPAQASAVEFEYRRFLSLMKLYPDEHVSPLFDVDLFWHYHILDTMKYAKDCERIFGYFLHHYPYSGLLGADDEVVHQRTGERMQELYETTFGEAYIRPEHAVMAWTVQAPETAWSNPAIGTPTQSHGLAPKTAWSNPATGQQVRSPRLGAQTAWSNPATGQHMRSPGPGAQTAWSNPTMGDQLRSQGLGAKTAWSNPASGNAAWLPAATPGTTLSAATGDALRVQDPAAITPRPNAASQNDRFFVRAAAAAAA